MSRTLEALQEKRFNRAMAKAEKAMRAVERFEAIGQKIPPLVFDVPAVEMPDFDALIPKVPPLVFDVPVVEMPDFDALMPKIPPLAFDVPVVEMQAVDTSGFDAAVRRMREIDTSGFDAVAQRLREMQLDFEALAARMGKASRDAIEERRRTLEELKRHAHGLECDSLEEFRDAGVFLRQAVEGFEEGVENADEYAFAFAYRSAVGALEEVARQLAGDGNTDLRRALNVLTLRGQMSQQDREWVVEVYELRNTQRGLGHGAGRCPEYTASFALAVVLRGLGALIPSSALPTAAELGA